jgi:hypothetical protein
MGSREHSFFGVNGRRTDRIEILHERGGRRRMCEGIERTRVLAHQ